MNSDTARVAQSFIAAINRHSVGDISELMSENHTFIDSQGHTVVGREAMITGWTAYFGMFPDFEIIIEQILTDGNIVAIFGRAAGTFNGKRGVLPQNRIAMPCAWKAVIADDKVKLWEVYADWTEGMKIVERESGPG